MNRYEDLTDEEVIDLVNAGDNLAVDYLINKYKCLVREKARTMYLIGGDNDDLIQEGMMGLFSAIRGYDKSKKASFYTFANLCITRQIYTAVQASQRQKHIPLNTCISLNVATQPNDESTFFIDLIESDNGASPETMIIDKETKEFLKGEINKRLSPLEKEVANLYLEGKNYVEIAKVIGKSTKAVDNALSRIKNKLNNIQE